MRENEEMVVDSNERVDGEERMKREPSSVCVGNGLVILEVE